jgi:protein TonB
VVLCADISKDGQIKNLRAVAGPPELVPPSIKAVSRWRYKPYLLNGEAVEVETEIKVNYALEH